LNLLKQSLSPAIWNIHTSIHGYSEIPFDSTLDGLLILIDEPGVNFLFSSSDSSILITGDLMHSEKNAPDKRYTIFGNLGLIFRYSLYLMEKQSIYSFHASSLYHEDKDELLLFVGGPGSGKTVLILEGLFHQGYKIFSTEMTHIKIAQENVLFYKGALWDNIRLGTLLHDFPDIIPLMKLQLPEVKDPWYTKYALNLSSYQSAKNELINPSIILVFPHIESGKKEPAYNLNPSEHFLFRALYQNLSEKADEDFFLYNYHMPFQINRSSAMKQERVNFLDNFIKLPKIKRKLTLFTGVQDCWKWYY
jgi:hypothetical protein